MSSISLLTAVAGAWSVKGSDFINGAMVTEE